jgi:precorrin-3B synthase
MTAPNTRGACPRLAAPMQTGDGLLARIVTAGPIPLNSFAALCAAAQEYGNGIMEISARGSLQGRGLTPDSAPLFASTVAALDIELCDSVPVISGPLPNDPTALIDADALASALRRAIAMQALVLAPKVSVVIDGGGHLHLDALTADLRLQAIKAAGATKLHLSLAGDAASATPLGIVAFDDAVDAAISILALIASRSAATRAADLLRDEGRGVFNEAVGNRMASAVPLPRRPRAEPIGLHRLRDGQCAIGVALAFGHASAGNLMAFARLAGANGAAWARPAPGRALLLGPIDEMTGFVLATAADSLGFVVDARDPRRRIVACAGAPGCASGLIEARRLAAELADHLPPSRDGIAVHVSGCAKGCAHPGAAPLTIVGTSQGCGLVHNGTAQAMPQRYIDPGDLVAEVLPPLQQRETVDA